jgi:hypothetical protein
MDIRCGSCGHSEKTNVEFFVKIIGASMPIGGFAAWVTYIFAGTGLAMPIVIAIVLGGTAILAFKDQIVKWIIDRGYKCSECGGSDWKAEA